MKYEHDVSRESLKTIEARVCHASDDVARSRFRRLFNEIDHLRGALGEVVTDIEATARTSFAQSPETFEADWQVEDPDGHAFWSRARAALGDGA